MSLLNSSQLDYSFNNIKIHQPTLSELIEIFKVEEDLIFCLKIFANSLKTLLNIQDDSINEFQVFMSLLLTNTEFSGLTIQRKEQFLQFIKLCFKGYEFKISSTSFLFQKEDLIIIVDETNFDEFKNVIHQMFDIPEIFETQDTTQYNPKNSQAARIAAQLKKDNAKREQLKGVTKSKKGLIENYLEILSIAYKIPPAILCEKLTLYNLFTLHKRFLLKVSWDLDIDCRLAGGSPEQRPDNWMSLF